MIEKQTSNTILQKKEKVTINGNVYEVAPPSAATLVLISEKLAVLPKEKLSEENVLGVVFDNAKYVNEIARSFAIMILGAKKIEAINSNSFHISKLFGKENEYDKLTNELRHLEISELVNKYVSTIQLMQVQNFFMLITFLREINLTKPTKKVIKTTASGQ